MEFRIKGEFKVKALKNMMLEVLGIPYGGPFDGRDSYGEYFNDRTNLHEDMFPAPPVVYYHGNAADGSPDDAPQYIGRTVGFERKTDGVWYQVLLDEASELARKLYDLAKDGLLRASSGSIGHLVRVDYETGHIQEWPVAEISLLDISMGQAPANPYAVALPVLKSVYKQAGLRLPDFPKPEAAEAQATPGRSGAGANKTQPTKSQGAMKMGVIEMTEAQLTQVREDAAKAERERIEAENKAKADREKEIEDAKAEAVKAAQTKWEEENKDALEAAKAAKTAGGRLLDGDGIDGDGGGLPVGVNQRKFGGTYRYDHVDDGALALAIGTLDAAKATGQSKGGISDDARKALALRLISGKDEKGHNVRALQAMKAAGVPMKANEINQSTLADYGDDWVGETYSNELWRRIVTENAIVSKIPAMEVPQGSESINIPLDGVPPTFYKVAQAADLETGSLGRPEVVVPASKMGTGKRKLELATGGARTVYTGQLEERSFLPWVEELRSSIVREGQETLEHVAIDGDTAVSTTTNINDIAGTPGGREAFLLADGFRKNALLGASGANSRDAGSGFDAKDFLETVKLMGLGGRNAAAKSGVEFILDMWAHWASLEIPEIKTRDVFVAPTLENGVLTSIWGYKVNVSGNMHRANQDATYGLKANAAGKIDLDTPANNTKGALLAVRFDQWRIGYQRRMTIEVTRYPESNASQIVALFSMGLINRDAEASAISYNVAV